MEQTPFTPPRNSTNAIVSLVSGIMGWTFLPFLGSIVAIITGHMAKSEIKRSAGMVGGNGMATAGLVLGYVAIGLSLCGICLVVILSLLGVLTIPFIDNVRYY